MGVERLRGVSRTSQNPVMVISVYLFIELINCSPHQSPLDRKAGDNSAPWFLQGSHYQLWIKWPWINEAGPWRWTSSGDGRSIGNQYRWWIDSMGGGNRIHFDGSACFSFQTGSRPKSFVVGVSQWNTHPQAPAWSRSNSSKTFSGLTHSGKVWSLAHKFTLATTVLQAYCCSLKTIENKRSVHLRGHYSQSWAAGVEKRWASRWETMRSVATSFPCKITQDQMIFASFAAFVPHFPHAVVCWPTFSSLCAWNVWNSNECIFLEMRLNIIIYLFVRENITFYVLSKWGFFYLYLFFCCVVT